MRAILIGIPLLFLGFGSVLGYMTFTALGHDGQVVALALIMALPVVVVSNLLVLWWAGGRIERQQSNSSLPAVNVIPVPFPQSEAAPRDNRAPASGGSTLTPTIPVVGHKWGQASERQWDEI